MLNLRSSPPQRHRVRLASVLALALSGWLTAAPASGQAAPAVSDGVVKLGILPDLSGPYSSSTGGGSVLAARMAIEDFGGSVLGAPIELVVADDRSNPEVAATTARDWFENQHVDAIMDVAGSSPALQVQAIARNRNKIVIINAAGAERLTNEACSPTAIHYVFDTYAVAHTVGKEIVERGEKTWFFVTVDYSFGYDLEDETAAVVKANGGKVVGDARYPLGAPDFSSYLARAQQSGAKVVAFANAGTDLIKAVRQAATMGLRQSGQTVAGLAVVINAVHQIGLGTAQGMMLSESFYWDMNEGTRAWSRRFFDRLHQMPNSLQAGVYSATTHYLQAVKQVGTDASEPVMQAMRQAPVDDFFAHDGHIRPDGVMVHNMYLFQVKTPEESHYPWDYYKQVATIPGDEAFRPLSQSQCALVRKP